MFLETWLISLQNVKNTHIQTKERLLWVTASLLKVANLALPVIDKSSPTSGPPPPALSSDDQESCPGKLINKSFLPPYHSGHKRWLSPNSTAALLSHGQAYSCCKDNNCSCCHSGDLHCSKDNSWLTWYRQVCFSSCYTTFQPSLAILLCIQGFSKQKYNKMQIKCLV